MNASANKAYLRADHGSGFVKGETMHLSTTWGFDYLPDFSYTGDFDYLLGSAEK